MSPESIYDSDHWAEIALQAEAASQTYDYFTPPDLASYLLNRAIIDLKIFQRGDEVSWTEIFSLLREKPTDQYREDLIAYFSQEGSAGQEFGEFIVSLIDLPWLQPQGTPSLEELQRDVNEYHRLTGSKRKTPQVKIITKDYLSPVTWKAMHSRGTVNFDIDALHYAQDAEEEIDSNSEVNVPIEVNEIIEGILKTAPKEIENEAIMDTARHQAVNCGTGILASGEDKKFAKNPYKPLMKIWARGLVPMGSSFIIKGKPYLILTP